MKALKNRSYIVAVLAIIFIGIAGGFTNTEYGSWNYAPTICKLVTGETWEPTEAERLLALGNPFMPQTGTDRPPPIIGNPLKDFFEDGCIENDGVIVYGDKTTWSIESMKQVIDENGNHFDTRINFDPKSTALFVIAGAIIVLVRPVRENR